MTQIKVKSGSVLQHIDIVRENISRIHFEEVDKLRSIYSKWFSDHFQYEKDKFRKSWYRRFVTRQAKLVELSKFNEADSYKLFCSESQQDFLKGVFSSEIDIDVLIFKSILDSCGIVSIPWEWWDYQDRISKLQQKYYSDLAILDKLKNSCLSVTYENDAFIDVDHPFFVFMNM